MRTLGDCSLELVAEAALGAFAAACWVFGAKHMPDKEAIAGALVELGIRFVILPAIDFIRATPIVESIMNITPKSYFILAVSFNFRTVVDFMYIIVKAAKLVLKLEDLKK